MFKKPTIDGWVDFTIKSKRGLNIEKREVLEGEASYTIDIPMEVLTAAIAALKDDIPFSFTIDEEGPGYLYYSCQGNVLHIKPESGDKTYTFNIEKCELIAEIVGDIERDIDDWADWACVHVENRKEVLLEKIKEVKVLLETQASVGNNKKVSKLSEDTIRKLAKSIGVAVL